MEQPMNFCFVRPLQQIALTRISIMLWNQGDKRNLLTKHLFRVPDSPRICKLTNDLPSWFHTVVRNITLKVKNLPLPVSLQEDVLRAIEPIGKCLLKWVENHNVQRYPGIYLPRDFSWTSYGTIDEKTTAKVLIKDKHFNIGSRFKLACRYCLAGYIHMLWNKNPSECKKVCNRHEKLVAIWTCKLEGCSTHTHLDKMIEDFLGYQCNVSIFGFHYAAHMLNKPAIEFFLQRLSDTEKDAVLTDAVHQVACSSYYKNEPRPDILCYLLSQMNIYQQMEVFSTSAIKILLCFLSWTYKDIIFEIIPRIWCYISEVCYIQILKAIISEIKNNMYASYFSKLFSSMWQISLPIYKRYVMNETLGLFRDLFKICDLEIIQLVFKDATVEEKKKLIFSNEARYILEDLLNHRSWDKFHFFLRECVTNKNEAKELKAFFEIYIANKIVCEEDDLKWDVFFTVLQNFISEFEDEKVGHVEDGTPSKKQRLC